MSKLTEISPGGNKEKGTRMRRLVSFCGRKFCVSIIIFVFFYMSAVAKNMGDSGQPLWSLTPVLAQSRPSEAVAPREETNVPSVRESNLMHNCPKVNPRLCRGTPRV